MKEYWESGGITPRILDFDNGWRWAVSFVTRYIVQWNVSVYVMKRENWIMCWILAAWGPLLYARSVSKRSEENKTVFQVEVFWIVTPCSVVVGYQRFRGSCCLHLHFTPKMEAAWTSETNPPIFVLPLGEKQSFTSTATDRTNYISIFTPNLSISFIIIPERYAKWKSTRRYVTHYVLH
jgi:hypothetical protein